MKRFLFIILLVSFSSYAQTDGKTLFDTAQKAYNDGKYQQAIDSYMQILKTQQHSTSLYYNLANAHYKKGEVAQSVYYYEKALQLSPNDEDVINNLKFANQMVIDKITPLPKTWLQALRDTITSWHTSAGWGIQAIICMILFVSSFLGYYFFSQIWQKRLFFTLMLIFVCLSAGSFWIGQHTENQNNSGNYGILFDKTIHVYSEPNTYSQEVFTLHEGTKIKVIEYLNDWYKIKIADGKTGWIKKSTAKII